MSIKPINRVLLINDDGIDAPGMQLLRDIADKIATEVWVVAPVVDQSGVSCSINIKAPLRIAKRHEKEYAVYGTPADCAIFAIKQVMKDNLPDLVLSGINSGSNLGFETLLSGTVGGAIMAMSLGVPAIALSQVTKEGSGIINWDSARHYGAEVIEKLVSLPWPQDVCMNVNFPRCDKEQVKGMKFTVQGQSDVSGVFLERANAPDNGDYYWLRVWHNEQSIDYIEHELDNNNLSYITITPLSYHRTDYQAYTQLKAYF